MKKLPRSFVFLTTGVKTRTVPEETRFYSVAKIWYDMSVSRRQNDITALRNIEISSGKSGKRPQFVTNPEKSTDSLTIQTLFHVEIRIVIF